MISLVVLMNLTVVTRVKSSLYSLVKSAYTDDTVMTLAVGLTFLDAQPSASDELEFCEIWLIVCVNLERCIRMPGMEECSDNGFVIQSARLTIVLVMALQCVFLQLRGYITISILSDTQQGFRQKLPTIIRKESRVLKQLPVLFFWQGQDIARQKLRNIWNMNFGYELNRTCDEIRPGYFHTETCMETVPEAITAFLEGGSFEDVIRTAVSLGGDCDTLTAIAGGIAEGFYGVPVELKEECYKRLPEPLLKVLKAFMEYLERNATVN